MTIDGAVLQVRDTPATTAGAEPAVYVHGLGGSSLNWTDLAGLLAARLDGQAVDLPGFGYSDPGRRYSIAAFADHLISYLEYTDRGPVHLVGNSLGGAIAAVESAGGQVAGVNAAIGMVTATSSDAGFAAAVSAGDGVSGVARDSVIGSAPSEVLQRRQAVEREGRSSGASVTSNSGKGKKKDKLTEPLAEFQWDMRMIDATPKGSYDEELGRKGVFVGIIDTGIDGSHPDIAPNFDRNLSRNFTVDIPLVDGPCEIEADQSCTDANDVDENSHGTHVAGTVASPIN